MIRQQRAKQFQPFDAMKGLTEALKDREERHSRVDKLEISEEKIKAIEEVLHRLKSGVKVRIEHYKAFHYVFQKGVVGKIDCVKKCLYLEEDKIFFDDIYEIRIIDY